MNNPVRSNGLTSGQINRLVYKYIGVNGGYLADFSYNSHAQFYAELDLPISPKDMPGTTRERFMSILEAADSSTQAKIVEGILDKYPAGSAEIRSQTLHDEIRSWIPKLRAGGGVLSPVLANPSEVVERALTDAEFLIANSGAVSGIDRLHTALHGYLRQACSDAGVLPPDKDPDLTKLLKQLREHHPKFRAKGARAEDIATMQNALASIIAVLNPIRNRASIAHPNVALLDAAEAHLVVNCVRTLLHYLEAKLRK